MLRFEDIVTYFAEKEENGVSAPHLPRRNADARWKLRRPQRRRDEDYWRFAETFREPTNIPFWLNMY
jgi:hypothetical protein